MFDIGFGNDGLWQIALLEGIGALFTIIAFILILIASIKLFRRNNIPGAKLIFYSIICTIIVAVISVSYTSIFDIEENYVVEALLNIFLAILFFIGSYGFWSLVKYSVSKSANNTPRSDA